VATVYHYTDTQAFKGVIENAALWATDFRYLNDSGELIYTWAAFVERLEKLVKTREVTPRRMRRSLKR